MSKIKIVAATPGWFHCFCIGGIEGRPPRFHQEAIIAWKIGGIRPEPVTLRNHQWDKNVARMIRDPDGNFYADDGGIWGVPFRNEKTALDECKGRAAKRKAA